MNRGDRREPIFKDDADGARFLETLGQKNTEGSKIKSKKSSLEMGFHKSRKSRFDPILTGLVHE
jgi:hypothetical protein